MPFETVAAPLDEEEAKAGLAAAGFEPRDMAEMLAEMKAKSVGRAGDALVLGADQTLELDDGTMLEQARLARRGAGAAPQLERPHPLSPFGRGDRREGRARLGRDRERGADRPRRSARISSQAYLDREYEAVRCNVGGYRIEGLGAQLFEEIEGSHFADPRPAAASPARLSARARPAARADGRPLCRGDRRSDRPFEIAADPQILAGEARASRATIAPTRVAAASLPTISTHAARDPDLARLQRHHAAQAGGRAVCSTARPAIAARIGAVNSVIRDARGAPDRSQYRRRRASSQRSAAAARRGRRIACVDRRRRRGAGGRRWRSAARASAIVDAAAANVAEAAALADRLER